jgi:ubiquinone/menaquinone biosynthesis C-methylase UbiE
MKTKGHDQSVSAVSLKLDPLQRGIQIMRSTSSPMAGIRELMRAVARRTPGRKKVVKQLKTGYWQDVANVDRFIEAMDSTENSIGAYLDAVVNEFFLSRCPAEAQVLDVGCGHGIVSLFLARHGRSVTACDVSAPMLQQLARNSEGLNIRIQPADVYNLPFADGEFDVVVARQFLGHFPDWPVVLEKIARCCRSGGRLLLQIDSAENAQVAKASLSQDCDFRDGSTQVTRGREEQFFARFDQRMIDKACKRAGLRVTERVPCMFFYHNRLIGHALGSKNFHQFNQQFLDRLKDPRVLDFVVWFEETALQKMPQWISNYSILVLEKQ